MSKKRDSPILIKALYKPDRQRMLQAVMTLLWPSLGAEQQRDQLNEDTAKTKEGGGNVHK